LNDRDLRFHGRGSGGGKGGEKKISLVFGEYDSDPVLDLGNQKKSGNGLVFDFEKDIVEGVEADNGIKVGREDDSEKYRGKKNDFGTKTPSTNSNIQAISFAVIDLLFGEEKRRLDQALFFRQLGERKTSSP
jgi:hypothetical protein